MSSVLRVTCTVTMCAVHCSINPPPVAPRTRHNGVPMNRINGNFQPVSGAGTGYSTTLIDSEPGCYIVPLPSPPPSHVGGDAKQELTGPGPTSSPGADSGYLKTFDAGDDDDEHDLSSHTTPQRHDGDTVGNSTTADSAQNSHHLDDGYLTPVVIHQ